MTERKPTVFLVDDDPGVLKALTVLLTISGYDVKAFASPREFLDHHDPSLPGCAIFDVAMPDIDGLELQASLLQKDLNRPVIFVTGFGDVPTSVRAMKAGAIDFIRNPSPISSFWMPLHRLSNETTRLAASLMNWSRLRPRWQRSRRGNLKWLDM